jgi:uncharacterized protein YbjT (DUF2867 family)
MTIKTKEKTALVFGYTGLIGGILTNLLLEDERYKKVKVFSRKYIDIKHPKLEIVINNLENINEIEVEIIGDDLFCCLGTTMKKAGSKTEFEKVDFHLPVNIARIASRNGVNKFLVVSSIGAGKKSSGFYLRTKGKMEEAIVKFPFGQISIFRPSLLLGKRTEIRRGEVFGKFLALSMGFLLKGPFKKYRPIQAEKVARAMIRLANMLNAPVIYESDKIEEMGRQKI